SGMKRRRSTVAIDDRIRQELEQVSQVHDQLNLFEDVARRAGRRRRVRRTARVLIAISVVAGTGIAFVLLIHLFGGSRKVPATEPTPAAGPANGKIVFAGITESHQGQHLFMVNSDGTGLEQLTFGDDVLDESPDWSPDGTRIAFRRDDRQTLQSGIFVLDIARGAFTRIPDGVDPAWSPDRTKIAFDTVRERQRVIAV